MIDDLRPGAAAPQASGGADAKPLGAMRSALFRHVSVTLHARLGEVTLPLAELLELKPGSVLTLDLQVNEPVELRLDEAVVARGHIVTVGDHFAVQVSEVAERG